VWRGGGVAHGPKPRDYSQKVNKKVMKLAFARALSDKIAGGDVIVVDEFKFEAPKTKLMAALLKGLGVDRTAVVVQKEVDDTTLLVTSNLPRVDYSTAGALDVYSLMLARKVVCDRAGFDELMARIAR
jgi:large subunit ribosomal protein L4